MPFLRMGGQFVHLEEGELITQFISRYWRAHTKGRRRRGKKKKREASNCCRGGGTMERVSEGGDACCSSNHAYTHMHTHTHIVHPRLRPTDNGQAVLLLLSLHLLWQSATQMMFLSLSFSSCRIPGCSIMALHNAHIAKDRPSFCRSFVVVGGPMISQKAVTFPHYCHAQRGPSRAKRGGPGPVSSLLLSVVTLCKATMGANYFITCRHHRPRERERKVIAASTLLAGLTLAKFPPTDRPTRP